MTTFDSHLRCTMKSHTGVGKEGGREGGREGGMEGGREGVRGGRTMVYAHTVHVYCMYMYMSL